MSERKGLEHNSQCKNVLKCLSVCKADALLILCIVFSMLFLSKIENTYQITPLKNPSGVSVLKDWSATNQGSIKGNYVFNKELPDTLDSEAILFQTYNIGVKVLVEGVLIYEFDNKGEIPFTKSPGSTYHIINMKHNYAGKKISIQCDGDYSLDKQIPTFYMGQPQQLAIFALEKNIVPMLIGLLLFALGIFLTGVSGVFRKKMQTKQPLQMGILALCFSIWYMLQTCVLQMIFNHEAILMLMESVLFLILPLCMVMNIKELFGFGREKGIQVLLVLYGLNLVISTLLQLMGIKDIAQLLPITHVLLVIGIIYFIFLIYKKPQRATKKVTHKVKIVSNITLSSVLVDLFCYYKYKSEACSGFTQIGILVFILCILIGYIQTYNNKTREWLQVKRMAELAYQDVMTGLYNRTAYAEDIARYEELLHTQPQSLNLIYVIFDLNDLKETNDIYGHGMGDYYIGTTGQIIKKAFEKIGKCYRIGGDEFAVIIKDRKIEDYRMAIKELKSLMKTKNDVTTELEFSLAYGYAIYEAGKFSSLKELVDQADKNMYENKNSYKENKLCEVSL